MTSALVEHLEYLTLPGRNVLFRRAIAATLRPGDTVADLGCGVGVLGLFCLEAGAAHVWGIDSSAAIHLAQQSLERAGLADRYTCIADSTFRTALSERVDLIICDHVGFAGFDYGIVPLMRDARRRFLKPGGAMIPRALDLVAAPVSSEACLAKAAQWGGDAVPEAYRWLEVPSRNQRFSHDFAPAELVGGAAMLGRVDLAADTPTLFRFEATLRIDRAGRFDGFAAWFDCELAGDVRMTNSPLDPASIRRPQAFFPALESFPVEAGDAVRLSLRFTAEDTVIAWTIHPPGGAPAQKLSTFNSAALSPAGLGKGAGTPVALTTHGEAWAFVLAQVDGQRSAEEILAKVLADRPDLLPSEQAIRDLVAGVLARHAAPKGQV